MSIDKLKSFESFEIINNFFIEDKTVSDFKMKHILKDKSDVMLIPDKENEYLEILNKYFTGYINLKRLTTDMRNMPYDTIAYVKHYYAMATFIYANYIEIIQYPVNTKITYPINVEIEHNLNNLNTNFHIFANQDILIKLKKIDAPQSKIRWYKKGKLENSNEEIRWFKGGKLVGKDPEFYKEKKIDTDFIEDYKFIQFLDNNGALEEYIKCIKTEYKENFEDYFDENILDNSLYWSRTDSGTSFWENLHTKWKKLYKEMYGSDDDENYYDDDLEDEIQPLDEGVRWYKNGKLGMNHEPLEKAKSYDDFITNDTFRQFLIDNNAYQEYVDYTCYSVRNNFRYGFDKNIITSSFEWANTPSGVFFWDKLDDKWRKIYNVRRKII
jgi:hypothetical protein